MMIDNINMQLNNMDQELITSTCTSSTHDVVCGVSYNGGIHLAANRMNWRVCYPQRCDDQ